MKQVKWIFSLVCILIASSLMAEDQVDSLVEESRKHQLVRRVVVFPIQVGSYLNNAAEETWWKVRERLTENKRFLVASKNFLIKKDVLQARGALSPADAIILGRLLDAHVLITTYLKDKQFHMVAYEGDYGQVVWRHQIRLHPSVPLQRQLLKAGEKLVNDFMASIPYQGFVVMDSLIGSTVYRKKDRTLVNVDIGVRSQAQVGDEAQIIRLYRKNFNPIFKDGYRVEVFAEGKIVAIERNIAKIEIVRVTDLKEIQEASLVRLPKELKRLKESFTIRESLQKHINPDYFSLEMKPVEEAEAENKALLSALGFLGNLAVWLILAF